MHPSPNNPTPLLWGIVFRLWGSWRPFFPSTWKEETKFSSSKDCGPLGGQLPGLDETGL